jgi:hypothetical protein
MKALSLKLDDSIFLETERLLSKIKKPRNSYFNEAVDFYNKYLERQLLAKQFELDIELAGQDSADMATSLENLDPELID